MHELTLSDLVIDQDDTAGLIERLWTNVLKLGKDNITLTVVEQRKLLLERYWGTFREGHSILIRHKGVTDTDYFKQDVYSRVEEAYLDASTKLALTIKRLSPQTSSAAPPKAEAENATAGVVLKQSQLPKIHLPTFNGDPLQWESYRDLFLSIVHNVPGLPAVQKLAHLKSSLLGEAADTIKNTQVTEAGYAGTWETLQARYGNERILSSTHVRNLLSCQPAKKSSPAELKRLLDTFRQSIRAFDALKKPIAQWDEWFVYILVQKLDQNTHMDWETSLANSREVTSFQELSEFLENRVHALEAAHSADPVLRSMPVRETSSRDPQSASPRRSRASSYATSTDRRTARKCPLCAGNHSLSYCSKFKKLPPMQRKTQAQQLRACMNCLNVGHILNNCATKAHCLACDDRHHTLLHDALPRKSSADPHQMTSGSKTEEKQCSAKSQVQEPTKSSDRTNAVALTVHTNNVVLLATARVKLVSPSGKTIVVKSLLDTGSDSSFVTEWAVQTLKLTTRAVRVDVSGVRGCNAGFATGAVNLTVHSLFEPSFKLPINAIALPKLTSKLSQRRVVFDHWPHLTGLKLADPEFANPARIDIILGADVCGPLFMNDSREGPPGTPMARLSPFGWILMGPTSPLPLDSTIPSQAVSCLCVTQDTLQMDLQRFWEIEEVSLERLLSEEDAQCEAHFERTHSRDETGRYVVRLPFRDSTPQELAPSRSAALAMWLNCERRLSQNVSLKQKYNAFLSEYLDLAHMEPVADDSAPPDTYYLPHHVVVKAHDPAKKVRVVFNASFKTRSGLSLNDCLFPGPKLQSDLWMILTRWRLFRVVFTADIVKMFRQIRVHHKDADWQRILWRPNPTDALQDFRLTTVTYGTATAPYLALRVLLQLAQDERERYPLGAQAIESNSYVDDILSGADDLIQAMEKKAQLVDLLSAGGFPLSKWASNVAELCPEGDNANRYFQEMDTVSTLGILWNPADDAFSLRVAPTPVSHRAATKRSVLSDVARLFDPLGWVSPVLVSAKILLQDVWIAGTDWDQELPSELSESWLRFRSALTTLENLKIPRWVSFADSELPRTELHGFCDASERALAATVYLRVMDTNGRVNVHLLVAKTKVAPVKTVSIPRLELCGAVLLTRLIMTVKAGLNFSRVPIRMWTDSQVTLAWIHGHASKWKPFVANRVAEIQAALPALHWRHVRTPKTPPTQPRELSHQLN